jgi:predicted AlkP superfamily phosphohydrolase/phosphomutase
MHTNPLPAVGEPTKAGRPVIFIGLDGAEPDLLRRWMDEGALPALAKMRRHGICENVLTYRGFGDGAIWPSLLTGLNPARHGRFFRDQLRYHSYRTRSFSVDSDLVGEPFWTTLSKAGRRVAVLDVPFAPLQPDINGVLLIDWLIHDRYGRPRSWPDEFVNDVLDRLGDDPINGNSDVFPKDVVSLKRLCDLLNLRVKMKEALVSETLNSGQWDLIATVFTEAHDLGHRGWHLHDPNHPQHDPTWMQEHGDPIKRLYLETDGAIGRILRNAQPHAAIVIFAGLGMGPDYTANGVMDQILARLENRPYRRPNGLSKRLKAAGFPNGISRIGQKVDTARQILALSRRRFFAMAHNENSGAIRINLRGREPTGRVHGD